MLEGRVMKQGVDSGAAGLQGADVHIQLDLTLHHCKPIEGEEPTWKEMMILITVGASGDG